MEELRQQIIDLKIRLERKEHDLMVIQQELNLIKARLEDAISQKHLQSLKVEQEIILAAETKELAEQARLAAEKTEVEQHERLRLAEEIKATKKAEEIEQIRPITPELDAPNEVEAEPTDMEITQIGEAEHEAIMRTIEEMSRSIGVSKTESRFEERTSLVDKVSKQKLNDIKRGIGINERFLFANELFAGDMSAFTRAVEELNHVDSETDANRLMNEDLASKYRWNQEDETVLAFKSLVSRRFVG